MATVREVEGKKEGPAVFRVINTSHVVDGKTLVTQLWSQGGGKQLNEESYIPKIRTFLFPLWFKLNHFSVDEARNGKPTVNRRILDFRLTVTRGLHWSVRISETVDILSVHSVNGYQHGPRICEKTLQAKNAPKLSGFPYVITTVECSPHHLSCPFAE
ncbi:hypothetical protein AV530_002197 [Patagioenas fasciata monilis]|uniref:Uncharacterized protein n=1 Tax=Patagioenas fasciata monilis TaxID=372326 RepID=A0A1V4K5F8_PATFA|nr:hypothetical protein AV530_002197 [Patagioenas fasciata monilis]